ncbi:hypothetical protein D3C77_311160 [compost metagenome]
MAGEYFAKYAWKIIRRAGREGLRARLIRQLFQRCLVQLAVRIQADRIDGNIGCLRLFDRLVQLLIRCALRPSRAFVEIVVAVRKQDDHRLVIGIGAFLQHLYRFLDSHGDIGVRPAIQAVDEIL